MHGHGWVWCHGDICFCYRQDGDNRKYRYHSDASILSSQALQCTLCIWWRSHPIHPTWRCVIIWRNASQARYNWMEPVLETVTRNLCVTGVRPRTKTFKRQNKTNSMVLAKRHSTIFYFPILEKNNNYICCSREQKRCIKRNGPSEIISIEQKIHFVLAFHDFTKLVSLLQETPLTEMLNCGLCNHEIWTSKVSAI